MKEMSDEQPVHRRRPRYKGRNPRRFEERYKELDPARYASDVEHIMAKGNTPVGTHRPICVPEILKVLAPQPGEVGLDVTLGYGGHAEQLLPLLLPAGRLFAVDADPIELPRTVLRLRAAGFGHDVLLARQMSYSGIRSLLYEAGGGFDFILADLGVSSMQLDNPLRGFSHKLDGPLDLRLNPNRGDSAQEVLNKTSLPDLETLLRENGDEPYALELAKAVKSHPGSIERTTQLADIWRTTLSRIRPRMEEKAIKKSLQRSFMALRIAVNQEFESLERFLKVLPSCLHPGGRVAILTFHSGEDRRVKKSFKKEQQSGFYSHISASPIRPTPAEVRSNPRASCAKLRWALRAAPSEA